MDEQYESDANMIVVDRSLVYMPEIEQRHVISNNVAF